MYMGVIGKSPEIEILRELRGARILITGLSAVAGVDVARAFAEINTRLIVHTTDMQPEVTALVALLSQSAAEMKLYTDPIARPDDAIRLAQNAQQAYGGLDAVINLQSISRAEMQNISTQEQVEALIAAKLTPLTHITHVAANRMRVVLSEGSVLNVLTAPKPQNAREAAIAGIARTALAAMTRGEAGQWADQAVRINGVGPRSLTDQPAGASLTSEPDLAALALYLASRRGKTLSGHIFDAEGFATGD
jgi:3-oxoacyl-[acyl-carrier protein] reductase